MVRRIVIASCLVSAACTAKPSRLEQISQESKAVAAAQGEDPEAADAPAVRPLPPAPVLGRHAVTLVPTPPGIDEALWREIGWFPADTVDIAGLTDRSSQSLVRWAEAQIGERFPECRPLFAGVERTYMVQQAGGAVATHVFHGAMTRAQERECLQVALGPFGATGEQRGDLTIISTPGGPGPRLAWFARDGGTMVILEGDSPLEGWLKPQGTLADQPALVRLVAAADRGQGIWAVGLRDYGTAFTGVESSGYVLATTIPASVGARLFAATARLEFASPEAAKQAERGAEAFARDVPGAAELGIVLTMRAAGNWLTGELRVDMSEANGEAIMAWLQQVLARANGATRGDDR